MFIELEIEIKNDTYESISMLQGYDYEIKLNMFEAGKLFNIEEYDVKISSTTGTEVENSDIIKNGNIIQIKLTKDFTRKYGKQQLQIILMKNGRINGTWVITCNIKESVIYKSDETGKVDIIETLQNEITEAISVRDELNKSIENGYVDNIRSELNDIVNMKIPQINLQLKEVLNYKGSYINAVELGIDNSGSTDITIFLQNLLNDYKMVELSEGTYKYTNLILNEGNILKGVGVNKTILNCVSTSGVSIGTDGLDRNVGLQDIYIEGNFKGASGINIKSIDNAKAREEIKNITVAHFEGDGIYLELMDRECRNLNANTCHGSGIVLKNVGNRLYNCCSLNNTNHGILVLTGTNFLYGCKTWLNGKDGTSGGISITGSHVTLTCCSTQQNYTHGLIISGNENCIDNFTTMAENFTNIYDGSAIVVRGNNNKISAVVEPLYSFWNSCVKNIIEQTATCYGNMIDLVVSARYEEGAEIIINNNTLIDMKLISCVNPFNIIKIDGEIIDNGIFENYLSKITSSYGLDNSAVTKTETHNVDTNYIKIQATSGLVNLNSYTVEGSSFTVGQAYKYSMDYSKYNYIYIKGKIKSGEFNKIYGCGVVVSAKYVKIDNSIAEKQVLYKNSKPNLFNVYLPFYAIIDVNEIKKIANYLACESIQVNTYISKTFNSELVDSGYVEIKDLKICCI